MKHPQWIKIVLEMHPKVFISPMREIAGVNGLIASEAGSPSNQHNLKSEPTRKDGGGNRMVLASK
jgi:hypothetical protein